MPPPGAQIQQYSEQELTPTRSSRSAAGALVFKHLYSSAMNFRITKPGRLAADVAAKVWPSLKLLRRISKVGGIQEVQIGEKRMFVDLRAGVVAADLFLKHTWEPEETRLIVRLLKQGDVFVDLGANLGYFDLIASDAVGSTGKVFAFEPAPGNLRLLRKNVEVNGCTNVYIEPKAVTDANRDVDLHLSAINHGDHRIFPSNDDNDWNEGRTRSSVVVEGITLDSYFPPGSRVDLIKMDIQGAEYFALKGMERLLRDNHDIVMMVEFWPSGLRQAGVAPSALLQELRDLGFIPHWLDNDELSPLSPNEALRSSGEGHLNLVFLRNDGAE